jgi:membrane-associated phospholipid phosphatase
MKNVIQNYQIYSCVCIIVCIVFFMQCLGEESNVSSNIFHQTSYWQNIKKAATEDLVTSGQNAITVGTSPAHFHWYNWTIAGAALGTIAIAFSCDQQVRFFFNAHQSSAANHFITPWGYYGSGYFTVGISSGLYLTGLGFSQPWLKETGRVALTSIVLTGIITGVLKISLGRSRPYVNNGPWAFDFPGTSNSTLSIPSGHTTAAFALSSVLASRISNPYATIGLYCLAALTASQRVYSDQHWLSDVILGASIGTAVGRIVARNSIINTEKIGFKKWEILPVFNLSETGISFVQKF